MTRDDAEIERAVRAVLPAVNLQPVQFHVERGFARRAAGRGKPASVALNTVATQLVYLGPVEANDPRAVAESAADAALASLTSASQRACESLVVAWTDVDGKAFAAAFQTIGEGIAGELLGSSWTAPEEWPKPMIDPSAPEADAINRAISRLRALVRSRRVDQNFEASLKRSLRLVELELQYRGGEGQQTVVHPDASAADEEWDSWVDRYERAVLDEWRRIGHGSADRMRIIEATDSGPLAGMQVFLSYARPDATTLARPVYEALASRGATVWFDQNDLPDQALLDSGLSDIIGGCDAYVLCATDELIERAGYATQELAWAIRHGTSGGMPRRFVIVLTPGTLLPSLVAEWPAVELGEHDRGRFAEELVGKLTGIPEFVPQLPTAASSSTKSSIDLPTEADLAMIQRRVRHMRRFGEIDQETLMEVIGSSDDTRRAALLRGRLLSVGDDLDWSGTFADIDPWPDDAMVADYRYRLAASRALAGTRWPLSGDLKEGPDMSEEVDFLANTPIPILEWTFVAGWAENERRLALRHYAGVLRVLVELLSRGLYAGLRRANRTTVSAWLDDLRARRQRCYDALVEQRLAGSVSWKAEMPTWDMLFRAWSAVLRTPDASWSPPLTSQVAAVMTANTDRLAAVAALVSWYALNSGAVALQSVSVTALDQRLARVDVYAACQPTAEPVGASPVRLGLAVIDGGDAVIQLTWDTDGASESGASTHPVPEVVAQALSLSRV